jgi:hypothetical protein
VLYAREVAPPAECAVRADHSRIANSVTTFLETLMSEAWIPVLFAAVIVIGVVGLAGSAEPLTLNGYFNY